MNERVARALAGGCRSYVRGEVFSPGSYDLVAEDWRSLYEACGRHCLTAVGYSVLSDSLQSDAGLREVKLTWALACRRIAARHHRRMKLIAHIGRALRASGIDAVVFKGIVLGECYRSGDHRECGDLDIYTGRDIERATEAIVAAGGIFEERTIKNTHIRFEGFPVENHVYTTDARGRRSNRELELRLRGMLEDVASRRELPEVEMSAPPEMFTALHMMRHTLHHYIWEGITVRNLLDWALFLDANGSRIDWPEFYRVCEKHRMRRFADAMNHISVNVFGAGICCDVIGFEPELGERILCDVMASCDDASADRSGGRLATLRNLLRNGWKVRDICGRSPLSELFYMTVGALFQRRLRF